MLCLKYILANHDYEKAPTMHIVALLVIGYSCREECNVEEDCTEKVFQENNLIAYANQELGCNYYLVLYDFNGQQYFRLNNDCIDRVAYPFDCNGNILCETATMRHVPTFRKMRDTLVS